MKLPLAFIQQDIQTIKVQHEKKMAKYRRNFNIYANNGRRTEDVREQYGNVLSFYDRSMGEDVGTSPSLNICKSAVDTMVSKISDVKVRPYFNPLLGTFKTRKVCRNAQVYFDEFFDSQDVYGQAVERLRYAAIFDVGCVWVDDEERKVKPLAPWEWFFDVAEYYFGKLTRCFIQQKQYPLIYLADKLKKGSDYATRLEQLPSLKVNHTIYWDLGHAKYEYVNEELIKTTPIDYETPPVVMLYREKPLKGAFSVSMIDDLRTIQQQINKLCDKISLAYELSPANSLWVPEGSEVKKSLLTNEIGAMYSYRPPPNGGLPVIVATPPAIDPGYVEMLRFWIQQAYEFMGISQLSAQAKKPSGLNSGVALQTVEDVESDRHNPVLQSFVRFLMRIAEVAIDVFPKDEEILPKRSGRANIKWSEIKDARADYSIQFSASSALSKDPKVKMEQIEKLIAMKIINPGIAAMLLELPDENQAYSIMTASYDYCQRVIERAVEEAELKDGVLFDKDGGQFGFYEVVDMKQMFGEVANTLIRLDANEEKRDVLDRLVALLTLVSGKINDIKAAAVPPQTVEPAAPPPEQMNPPAAPGPTGPLPVAPGPPPMPQPAVA